MSAGAGIAGGIIGAGVTGFLAKIKIDNLKAEIRSLKNHINTLQSNIWNLQNEVTSRNNIITQKDRMIKQAEEQTAIRDAEIIKLKEELKKRPLIN